MKALSCSAEMIPAVMALLCAVVTALRAELLNATVGDSLLIRCELPVPLKLQWFYWQEDGTENILIHCKEKCEALSENYTNRVTAFESEFSSGNISIRLHGVTAADDRRSFWAFARYIDSANTEKTCEHCCNSTLQVSAPYRDLNLTIDATHTATCTARGGYPQSSVSWCGQHKADGECVDLHGDETTHKENPKDGTFTVMSSISVKELVNVTCRVVGLHSNKSISRSLQMDRGVGGAYLWLFVIIIPVPIIGYCIYKKCCKSGTGANGQPNGGGGNVVERHELREPPREGGNEGNEHQRNANHNNEEELFVGGEENQEDRPAGAAQPECNSNSTPRRRGSPRTSEDAVTARLSSST